MRKLIFGILVAFSVVSVSMGAWIPESDEENYQKLKVEVEEVKKALRERGIEYYQNDAYCEFGEGRPRDEICEAMNVVAFFDEIRASDAQPVCGGSGCKKSNGDYERKMSVLRVAVFKIREMPRFKENSGIYSYVKRDNGWGEANLNNFLVSYRGESPFWESVWQNWKKTKRNIGVGLVKQGVFDEWKDGK